MTILDYTCFEMLTYTIKQVKSGFDTVVEDDMAGKMTRENEAMLFICDRDGYAKAQSRPMPIEKGEEIFKKMLADGMPEFSGEIRTVS